MPKIFSKKKIELPEFQKNKKIKRKKEKLPLTKKFLNNLKKKKSMIMLKPKIKLVKAANYSLFKKNLKQGFFTFNFNKKNYSIPFETGKGILQGVFVTPKKELIIMRINDFEMYGYSLSFFNLKKKKCIADFSPGMIYKKVDKDYRKLGLATVALKKLEKERTGKRFEISTPKFDTSLFLLSQGYLPKTKKDALLLEKLLKKLPPIGKRDAEFSQVINFEKKIKKTNTPGSIFRFSEITFFDPITKKNKTIYYDTKTKKLVKRKIEKENKIHLL